MRPWHLKLAYLASGRAASDGNGSVEEWWAGPDRWRREYTVHGVTSVEVHAADGTYVSRDFQTPGTTLELVLQQVIHPVDDSDIAGSELRSRPEQFGKLQLDCIMLAQPVKGLLNPPFGLFPTYCSDGDTLRLSHPFVNTSVITQKTGTFQGHSVAVHVQLAEEGQMSLDGSVEQLATYSPEDSKFATDELKKIAAGPVRASGAVMAGSKISGPQPIYPLNARRARISGTVVLEATIGTDGRIHKLKAVSSPDPDLLLASIAAVQQWRYKPYLLNGGATPVQTTVTCNFNLRVK